MLLNESEPTSSELKCPKCNDTYIRLRQLPCGHSLCTYCIKESGFEASNKFKCFVCEKIHSVPNDGFSADEPLLNKQLNQVAVSQKEKSEQFKLKLEKIKANLNQAEFEFANGDYVVTEFCRDLKDQIQLTKELKIQELEDISEKMMCRIDNFREKKLHSLLNTNKANHTFKYQQSQLPFEAK